MHLDELKNRKRALRRLGFATTDDVVEQKGRVACEISSGDELLLTEMIFNGVFNDLTPQQCAALLSCFVFDEKVRWLCLLCYPFDPSERCADGFHLTTMQSEQASKLKDELAGPLRVMQEAARRIAKIAIESKLPVVEGALRVSFHRYCNSIADFGCLSKNRGICRFVQTRVDGRRL